ncbi:pentatricopeptide repeat-containing At1g62260, mitochondrial [Olea europaea subsp. europaea]|uniref:Pentatricopeptide repeat-containing At1g62260, mitochondrial n=1 Tax=Olea europaea subsp. europaea TaxID=158383 RepID=A0A8S0RHN8_OLEEU|nr:pentatricopeptide repeat-containing At1g62260, mitochondrial [Olea europaea subsp. europaea]
MITGVFHNGDVKRANEFLKRMPERDAAKLSALFLSKTRYTFSWEEDLIQAYNTLIVGYGPKGRFEDARRLFDQIPSHGYKGRWGDMELARIERMPRKNQVCWNTIITGCEENAGYKGSIELLLKMQGEKPDRHTLSLHLSVTANWQLGRQIHQFLTKAIPNIPLNNSLITVYELMGLPTRQALELFELMKQIGVRPTYITFKSVLSALVHAGLVEQGRVHNDMDLARVAAKALMTLEPESTGAYVVLYNNYAESGRWDDAKKIRMLMDKNNIKKNLLLIIGAKVLREVKSY